MKTIGIISDTHGTLYPEAYAALADCDVIIHAGDIGGPSILRELEGLAPVHAVLGNNDYAEYGPQVARWARPVIEGLRFLVAHRPDDIRISGLGGSVLAPGDPIPHVLICGHTHQPLIDRGKAASPALLVMNPGSATRPRGGNPRSVGKIQVEDGRILAAWVEDFAGNRIR